VTGLGGIRGITLDVTAGKMYWADSSGGKIQRANLNGSSVQTLVTGLSYPQGIALDAAGGKMYWTASHAGKVQRANLNGSSVQDLVTGLSYPAGIALDVASGKIYFADRAGRKILRANLNGAGLEDHITSYFRGVFDGNGHTISNFQYSSTGKDEIGLFSFVVGETAEIKNLGLVEPDVNAETGRWVGSLVGYLGDGSITNCWAEGGFVSGHFDTGGLAGVAGGTVTSCHSSVNVIGTGNRTGGLIGDSRGSISNSYAVGDVQGTAFVGGLIGNSTDGTVSGCFATGSVGGTSERVGGLVGNNNSTLVDCYATGAVSGEYAYNGGLVGVNEGEATILNCYSTGAVPGLPYAGGLVGDNRDGIITASFWDTETSGRLSSDGGTAKTTVQMQRQSTFASAGWDFATPIWTICEWVDYPRLWWQAVECPKYGGGSGTAEDPYLIYTAGQMNTIGVNFGDWDKHFKLMDDIDLGGYTWSTFNMIGTSSVGFHGVFDGNGRSILNFTYSITGSDYVGLFRSLEGEIKDLGLVSPLVYAGTGDFVGALVGDVDDGTVSNCYVEGGSVSGNIFVGGLVGGVLSGSISKCYSNSNVTGEAAVGGLVGSNLRGLISNCYATGSVSGGSNVGGLAGNNELGSIYRCYSAGSVSGGSNVGGLLGIELQNALTWYCFWDIEASGQATSAGGTGKTTAEMRMESTFTAEGWDFTTPVWWIDEGVDYPRLTWEVALSPDIDMDEFWMYQSLPGQSNSDLTAGVSVTDDPMGNATYSYEWEIVLPGDVSLAPVTVDGGGAGDGYWTFAARGCDEPGGLSDSGQTFTVRVTVTGDDYGNTGQAEAEFGIALLGDTNNDGVVNVADRSIANAFWRTGSAGPYFSRDCDVNCDGVVNVADRSIANAIWRGILGQNSVSNPCPMR
jgi:hypothetical protein